MPKSANKKAQVYWEETQKGSTAHGLLYYSDKMYLVKRVSLRKSTVPMASPAHAILCKNDIHKHIKNKYAKIYITKEKGNYFL